MTFFRSKLKKRVEGEESKLCLSTTCIQFCKLYGILLEMSEEVLVEEFEVHFIPSVNA